MSNLKHKYEIIVDFDPLSSTAQLQSSQPQSQSQSQSQFNRKSTNTNNTDSNNHNNHNHNTNGSSAIKSSSSSSSSSSHHNNHYHTTIPITAETPLAIGNNPVAVGGLNTPSSMKRSSYGTDAKTALDIAVRKTDEVLTHEVKSTDTLQGLSIKYGISIENLKRSNNLWNQNALMIRKSISIPVKFCNPATLTELGWKPNSMGSSSSSASSSLSTSNSSLNSIGSSFSSFSASSSSSSSSSTGNTTDALTLLAKYDSQLAQSKAFVNRLDEAFPAPLESFYSPQRSPVTDYSNYSSPNHTLPNDTSRPASFDKGKRKLLTSENDKIIDGEDFFQL